MANITKKRILQTFTEMLETTPFDRITVTALTKTCEISHNTFYYHYHDIYELLDAWLEEKLGGPFSLAEQAGGEAALCAFLNKCKEHKRIVYHIFDSLSRDQLERYTFARSDWFILPYIRQHTKGKELSGERLKTLSAFCRYSFLGFFLEFLWNDMEDDAGELAAVIYGTLSNFVLYEMERP